MLSAAEVGKKEFTVTRIRPGYDQDEVDNFLDRVHDSLVALEQHAAGKASADTAVIPRITNAAPPQVVAAPPMPTSSPASAARILELAQETADRLIEEARGQGNIIIATSHHDAEKVLAEARAQAVEETKVALDEQHRAVGELETRRARLSNEIEEFAKQKDSAKAYFSNAISVMQNAIAE